MNPARNQHRLGGAGAARWDRDSSWCARPRRAVSGKDSRGARCRRGNRMRAAAQDGAALCAGVAPRIVAGARRTDRRARHSREARHLPRCGRIQDGFYLSAAGRRPSLWETRGARGISGLVRSRILQSWLLPWLGYSASAPILCSNRLRHRARTRCTDAGRPPGGLMKNRRRLAAVVAVLLLAFGCSKRSNPLGRQRGPRTRVHRNAGEWR